MGKKRRLKRFLKQFPKIKEMRKNRDSPVDKYGAERIVENMLDQNNPKNFRFGVLCSLLLSSQTRDEMTFKAMKKLTDYGLTVQNINEIQDIKILEELIKPAGFYRKKAKQLKEISKTLIEEYDSDIPDNFKDLVKLKGIGTKMGTLIMNLAYPDQKTHGISVDVHVHRITNRLRWVRTEKPEETQIELEDLIPEEYWEDVNYMVVGFGQKICKKNPKCSKCSLNDSCKYYKKLQKIDKKKGKHSGKKRKRKKKEEEEEEEDEDLENEKIKGLVKVRKKKKRKKLKKSKYFK